ncbi:MAG: hypothetical protein C0497_03180 [Gemmatimonas sp.]|nr:hypothetical protein [Gemmatimonas sp.]
MDEPLGTTPVPTVQAVEAWLRTADALLCGLNHALSNRVSGLAIISLLREGWQMNAAEVEELTAEMAKLDDLLRLYRLLERHDAAQAEPILVPDAVSDALALFAHHPLVREVTCTVSGDADTPPVLLVPSAFVHALALLISAAAVRIDGGTRAGGLHLSYAHDAALVSIVVETRTPAWALPEDDPNGGVPELAAIGWLTRGAAVSVAESRTSDGALRLEMRLRTLARARTLKHT